MVTENTDKELLAQISRLTPAQKQKVLEFARELGQTRELYGESGASLISWLASIEPFDPEDLKEMQQAIDEDCEQIDLNEW